MKPQCFQSFITILKYLLDFAASKDVVNKSWSAFIKRFLTHVCQREGFSSKTSPDHWLILKFYKFYSSKLGVVYKQNCDYILSQFISMAAIPYTFTMFWFQQLPNQTIPYHIPMATIPPTPCFGEFRKEKLMSNLALCDWWPGYLYTFYTSSVGVKIWSKFEEDIWVKKRK